MIQLNNLQQLLADNNYQFTWQRKLVLQLFLDNQEEHFSAREIHNTIQQTAPALGLSTVYRILDVFLEVGLIQKVNFATACQHYELAYYHCHLVCTNCDKIIEAKVDKLEAIKLYLKNKYQFKVTDYKLEFYGQCQECG